MSRIRTIKPDFWTSEQIVSCSRDARLLFIGLWNFSDDAGIHPASFSNIKMQIFPGDNLTIDQIKKLVDELLINNLLQEYIIDGKAYLQVTGWKKHQRIDKPTYKFPPPESELKTISNSTTALGGIQDSSTTTSRSFTEPSSTTPRTLVELSTTDRNVMDRNGKEINTCEAEASPCIVPANPIDIKKSKVISPAMEIFQYWQEVLNHPRAKLDNKRKNKIESALKIGYSVEELKLAIKGCSLTAFNMGQNDRNQKYDDIELILRDAPHIDRFIETATTPTTVNNQDIPNWMAGAI